MMDLTVSLKLELKQTRTIRTIYLEVSLSYGWTNYSWKVTCLRYHKKHTQNSVHSNAMFGVHRSYDK